MMVNESTSGGPKLSAESLRALEGALTGYLTTGRAPADLEPSLLRLALEAREKEVTAEQLLILLKDVWYSIPQIDRAASREEQNTMLQRAITMCVRAYYSAT